MNETRLDEIEQYAKTLRSSLTGEPTYEATLILGLVDSLRVALAALKKLRELSGSEE
jgi:hypothetical protein